MCDPHGFITRGRPLQYKDMNSTDKYFWDGENAYPIRSVRDFEQDVYFNVGSFKASVSRDKKWFHLRETCVSSQFQGQNIYKYEFRNCASTPYEHITPTEFLQKYGKKCSLREICEMIVDIPKIKYNTDDPSHWNVYEMCYPHNYHKRVQRALNESLITREKYVELLREKEIQSVCDLNALCEPNSLLEIVSRVIVVFS